MTERVYLPSDYVDEICPPLRPSPSDWIVERDGAHYLAADEGYRAPAATDGIGALLAVGTIVSFDWREVHPTRILTVRIDDTGRVTHDPVGYLPAGLNTFWTDGDPDTMVDTLQGFLDAYHDLDQLEDGQEIEFEMAEWGDASFRFLVDGAGARFVPVDGEPGPELAETRLAGLPA